MTNKNPLINLRYVWLDTTRILKIPALMIFGVMLPVALYVFFGVMQDYATSSAGNYANVSAVIMVSMALYGTSLMVNSLGANVSSEFSEGWGRLLALTPYRKSSFVVGKVITALLVGLPPVVMVFVVGVFTNAKIIDWWRWLACAGLVILVAVVFSLMGLSLGVMFRAETATGIASGLIFLFSFLANVFAPLSGFLFKLSVYTPMWGAAVLAKWPLVHGVDVAGDGTMVTRELWQPILNLGVWSMIFAGICLVALRKMGERR